MLSEWHRWLTVAGLFVLLSGCASEVRVMVAGLNQEMVGVELADTPFYAQVTDQCGPAALAATLNVAGVSVAPETLKSQIYLPGREGSLQIELLAATRGYQRIPYLIDTDVVALLAELRADRPVLVLQNLGSRIVPIWHYAVVVGYLPDNKQFVLRSGDKERHLVKAPRFVRTWRKAGYWGMVTLLPGELPALPDADRYVRSVAAIESSGDVRSAMAGYVAATERWPQHSLAWLGLGNAHYAQGNLHSAEDAYQRLLIIDSDHPVALNNLAQVQADKGCFEKAADTLDAALAATETDAAMYKMILASIEELGTRSSNSACL